MLTDSPMHTFALTEQYTLAALSALSGPLNALTREELNVALIACSSAVRKVIESHM